MSKKVAYIILLIVALVAIGAGFYYREGILGNVEKKLEQFRKTNLANGINEITKQVFSPDPLHIGGKANNVVLVKAKIIAQTNAARFDNGLLPPLVENEKLSLAALAKANNMFDNQYFEHVSPAGVDPGTLVKQHGYDYIVSGENLILGNFKDEQELVEAWMNSPGHRANILNNRFIDIGVAIIKGTYKGDTVWIGVQEFGLPLASCQAVDANLKATIDANMVTLDNLSARIDAKRGEIERAKKNSQEYNNLVSQYNDLVGQYNQLKDITQNIITQYNMQVNQFNACVADA